MQADLTTRTDCRLCRSENLEEVISLASTPPANELLAADQLDIRQDRFPLRLYFCHDCHHLQLLDVVSPERLFRHYVYVSGTSPVFRQHFRDYAASMVSQFALDSESFVLDIGSNDGTLLAAFKELGVSHLLGIDPASEIAAAANAAGIPTIAEFFTPELADEIRNEHGAAALVVANNVFAHVDDLASIADGVVRVLDDRGVFTIEVSYLKDVLEKTLFDTIYHEHLDYHAVGPLQQFLEARGLRVIDAEEIDTHGGSLRLTAMKNGQDGDVKPTVAAMIEREQQLGLYNVRTYVQFQEKIDRLGAELVELLSRAKTEGKSVAAFGLPAKATTLMHQFNIDGRFIDYVVDDNPLKQGMYSPGFKIPIVPSDHLRENPPDYVIVLAWNFADSIVGKLDWFLQQGGRIIVPLPTLRIVGE